MITFQRTKRTKRTILALLLLFSPNAIAAKNTASMQNYTQHYKTSSTVCGKGYCVQFNPVTKTANYVMYTVFSSSKKPKIINRTNDFKKDPRLPSITKNAYVGSGYDRGHLAPAASFYWNKQAQHESFYMSNMTPQIPNLNRGKWKKIESRVRTIARSGDVDVIDGPIWGNFTNTKILESNVHVPISFFKIIIQNGHIISFIMPNIVVKKYKLSDYIVSVNKIEQLTGINFFVNGQFDKSNSSIPTYPNFKYLIH